MTHRRLAPMLGQARRNMPSVRARHRYEIGRNREPVEREQRKGRARLITVTGDPESKQGKHGARAGCGSRHRDSRAVKWSAVGS